MGARVPRLPVTPKEQTAGLRMGRNLYQEDLDRYQREASIVRGATIAILIVAALPLIGLALWSLFR